MAKTTPANPDDLVAGMSDLSIGTMRGMQDTLDGCPPRPGFGTAGKPINVNANMFLTRFKSHGATVNHYDVEIDPVVKVKDQKKPRALLQKVWDQMVAESTGDVKKALEAAAYDQQKSAFTPYDLPLNDGKCELIVALREDGEDAKDDTRRFRAVFQPAENQKVDLDTIISYCKGDPQSEQAREAMLRSVQAINILFRQDPASKYSMSGAAGRRFFSTDGAIPLPQGAVLYKGFQQSFRWTAAGFPAIQIDTAYSAFVQPGMLPDVCAGLVGLADGGGGGFDGGRGGRGGRGFDRGGGRGGRGGSSFQGGGGGGRGASLHEINQSQLKKLGEILKGGKFKVTHRKSSRIFTIAGLTRQPAEALRFMISGRDGQPDRQCNVVQYFKEQYNVTVTRPRLPCVKYGKSNFIPLEFVKLEPFHSIPMLKITGDQTAEIVNGWRQTLNYNNLPKLKAWGLEVQPKMMSIPARVLQPPQVLYGQGKSVRANFGSWNMKGVKFTKPGRALKHWSIVSFDPRVTLDDAGCPVENKNPLFTMESQPRQVVCSFRGTTELTEGAGEANDGILSGMQEAARKAFLVHKVAPQLVVVIMPKKDPAMYQKIKAVAAEQLRAPVVTQCLQSAKIKNDRGLDQYCGNVAMKIHAKLGGLTHQVQHSIEKNTMMIGADVTHPPPRDGAIPPSIAVSVGAVNGENNQFRSAIRLQGGRVEIIQDLEDMMVDHITAFERNTKAKPQKILFFRDGVSEGQYSHCVEHELQSIKKAARRLDSAYKPKVTFVICAKRHAMRFFAQSDQDRDRTGNLPPGTVVDRQVTSPMGFDFYLQAHSGLQGTARPTHYVVVADENKYTADKLQQLVNNLCYSFARATRSVSLVPVAYYADIIAEQCRAMVYSDESDASTTAPSVSSFGGRRELMTFDPHRLKKRLEGDAEFNRVAWYM
ncbi:hypothetical protein IAR55_005270 [Kwoniella newhampshirensis]|uniref:Argonaute n=1 Tax=Kwoniella newhampshirensis TaxID=1651941 RepID=A0AAW0YH04_9TREE